MDSHPGASEIYQMPPFHHFLGPRRSIVCWTMTQREIYHLQFCDYESDIPPSPDSSSYITTITNPTTFRTRFADFAPIIQHILNSTTTCTQWRIAELPPLPTYASGTSRIVLLGDAAHAIQSFVGQGANMAIEDGAALTALLALMEVKEEIRDVLRVYDRVRIPRLAGIREVIDSNRRLFGLSDPEEMERRNQEWAGKGEGKENGAVDGRGNVGVALGIVEEREVDIVKKVRGLGRDEREMWIDGYDAAGEARKAWVALKAERVKASI